MNKLIVESVNNLWYTVIIKDRLKTADEVLSSVFLLYIATLAIENILK